MANMMYTIKWMRGLLLHRRTGRNESNFSEGIGIETTLGKMDDLAQDDGPPGKLIRQVTALEL